MLAAVTSAVVQIEPGNWATAMNIDRLVGLTTTAPAGAKLVHHDLGS